eukprot:TRINITY_DN10609_c0_g3_i3.p1 TRINITY_DN10609_c0_g3~~TRINITY_DN10609_c0_g3_i3.p1  ORF type:complete len:261 (-),score=76.66 TRINITY_DN10609_c0_g3_i3:170-952(-)
MPTPLLQPQSRGPPVAMNGPPLPSMGPPVPVGPPLSHGPPVPMFNVPPPPPPSLPIGPPPGAFNMLNNSNGMGAALASVSLRKSQPNQAPAQTPTPSGRASISLADITSVKLRSVNSDQPESPRKRAATVVPGGLRPPTAEELAGVRLRSAQPRPPPNQQPANDAQNELANAFLTRARRMTDTNTSSNFGVPSLQEITQVKNVLRKAPTDRSPGGTPMKNKSQPAAETRAAPPHKHEFFFQQLQKRFKNVRSPPTTTVRD